MAANDDSSMCDALVGEILAMAGETALQRLPVSASLARDFKAAAEGGYEPRLSGRNASLPEVATSFVCAVRHMTKKTFGQVLRGKREALALTQRQLALQLGVKSSHVAYLESGLRRPSISLLRRIVDVLRLDGQELFFLSHPDAKYLVNLSNQAAQPKRPDDAWRRFVSNRALLERHKVTPAELKVLRQVSLLRRVSSPRQFLLVLNSIRQASEDEDFLA